MVLTDGEHEIRTRCGNRIADTPQGPVNAAVEPQADVFETKVQQADAAFPAGVEAGTATPMGGILFGQPVTTAALPAPGASQQPGPVTVAGGGGGGGIHGGGSGGAGGAGGGGMAAVSPDGATWPGYFGNLNGNPGVLVLQAGTPSTYVTNQPGIVYNYSTNLTVQGSMPGVGSVIYSPSFSNATFGVGPYVNAGFTDSSGWQVAFGGVMPAPVFYSFPGIAQVGPPGVNAGGATTGTPGVPYNPGQPGAPGLPGNPGQPGVAGAAVTPDPLLPGQGPNTAVPEPGTFGMGVIAAIVAAWLRGRVRTKG